MTAPRGTSTALLAALARDQAIKVRAAIADAVKATPRAPHDLILLLARDEALPVSDPVIRLSPVLTDTDLIALLATPPHASAAQSIASRTGLSATVAEAIIEHADAPAIRALLANHSACIQETTLDALVGRAAYHVDWHAPLVQRPRLSAKAVRALTQFVASDLLASLAARTDLEPGLVDGLRARIGSELALAGSELDDDKLLAECGRLKMAGGLTEDTLIEAAQAGDMRRAVACLAVASGVPLAAVDRMIALRSAKGLVSLSWRAGFGMRAATLVQTAVAQLGPDDALQPAADGTYPLSAREMEWHIELHAEPSLNARSVEQSQQPSGRLAHAG